MTLYRCFDAAVPPATAPPGTQAVLGYIGRAGQTPHVWTLPEWQRFAHLRQFPAYVPDFTRDPAEEATTAVNAALALGWAPFHELRRAITFDFETATGQAPRSWWAQCAAEVEHRGFLGDMYGSLATVLDNAASYVWAAAWDDSAVLLPGQTIVAHQYQDAGSVDYSVMGDWLWARGGQGPRHG